MEPVDYKPSGLEVRMEAWHNEAARRNATEAALSLRPFYDRVAILAEPVRVDADCRAPALPEAEVEKRRGWYENAHKVVTEKQLLLAGDDGGVSAAAADSTRQLTVEAPCEGDARCVSLPNGPNPNAPCRVILCIMDPGRGFTGARAMADDLGRHAEVISLTLPGRLGRAAETIRDLTLNAQCVRCHRTLVDQGYLSTKPYALYGHGAGATVAYEVAQLQMISKGRMPTRLFVSGCRAPQNFTGSPGPPPFDGRAALSSRSDVNLLAFFWRIRNVVSDDANLAAEADAPEESEDEFAEQRFKAARDRAAIEAAAQRRSEAELDLMWQSVRENPWLRQRAAAAARADCLLLENHVNNAKYAMRCPITALAGADDASLSDSDLKEWKIETKRRFRTSRPPGGAAYLLSPVGRAHAVRLVLEALRSKYKGEYDDYEESEPEDEIDDPMYALAQRIRGVTHGPSPEDASPFALEVEPPDHTTFDEPRKVQY